MVIETDYLIIGSGLGGLSTALRLCEYGEVVILSKREAEEGATKYAQGGIATVWSERDSFESHIEDTLRTGCGLCHKDVVELTVKSGPEVVKELIEWGINFSTLNKGGQFDLGKEGGHSHRRILHVNDTTGLVLERVLLDKVKESKKITLLEHHMAIDLIRGDKYGGPKRCVGAYVLRKNDAQVIKILARHTILCTGGAGKVYLYTSNPDTATGDGVAMAYRIGAEIANMEFYQFHPTCFYEPKAKNFLISEAVRGEGAILRRIDGERFMLKYHPMVELAPRDIVSRAIDEEMKKTGDEYVLLDLTHLNSNFIKERFPSIYNTCLKYGIDITQEPIPVVPAAHYMCGGVVVDIYGGVKGIEGLWAVGECAHTGLHGANRLASNSLLEALVFSKRVAQAIKNYSYPIYKNVPDWEVGTAVPSEESVFITQSWDEVRRLMWNYVGIVRSNKRLLRARRRLEIIWEELVEYYWKYLITPDLIELRNIATVAKLIIESASFRKESRGLHYTIDYPYTDDNYWLGDTILRKDSPPWLRFLKPPP